VLAHVALPRLGTALRRATGEAGMCNSGKWCKNVSLDHQAIGYKHKFGDFARLQQTYRRAGA
jgi:hypothetical protein